MVELRNLHDSTFDHVQVDWADGSLLVSLAVAGDEPRFEIVGRGLSSLILRRERPWGPSVSVNKCEIDTAQDRWQLKIEMQSGDEIIAHGEGSRASTRVKKSEQ